MAFVSTIGIAWSHRSWAGGGIPNADPGIVLTATPHTDRGVLTIAVTWPGAAVVQLVRIHPDGSHNPVRGGYPLVAPALTVDDGECPLDLPVIYTATDPSATGGTYTGTAVTLPSGELTWLTHPDTPSTPIPVQPKKPPQLERPLAQGIFVPIGARYPIVVSAAQRQASKGTVEFVALSFAERDNLVAAFADGRPVLLRAPADYGYGSGSWLALGAVTEDRENRKPWQDAVVLTAPFVEVDAPAIS